MLDIQDHIDMPAKGHAPLSLQLGTVYLQPIAFVKHRHVNHYLIHPHEGIQKTYGTSHLVFRLISSVLRNTDPKSRQHWT